MPIVDYNRIYGVRSRERQPVLNSPRIVPDAAGAFMRAASGVVGANAAVARAQAGIAADRAKERDGRLRSQYAAIGNLLGVGRDVGVAFARAVERRDEADFNALAAAWQNHMNEGADKAWRAPRQSDGNGGWTGPSVAIRDLDKAFDGTEAFETARAGVKERFQKWRAEKSRTYFAKADQAQADQADAYKKAAWEEYWTGRQDELKQYYDPGDAEEWRNTMDKLAPELADAVVQKEIEEGTPVLPGHRAGLEKELRAKFTMERYAHWCNLYAASDAPADESQLLELEWAALSPEEREKQKDKFATLADWQRDGVPDLDDAQRFALNKQIEAAKKSRNGNIERVANAAIDSANDIMQQVQLGSVTDAELMESMGSFADSLENGRVPDRIKLPMLDKMDTALAVRRALSWEKELKKLEVPPGKEVTEEQRNAYLEKLNEIKTMPEKQKNILMRRLYGGAAPSGAGGNASSRSRFTASDASFWLGRGEIGYALDQAEEAYKAGDMTDEDYFKTVDNCRKRAVFNKAVGDKGPDYVKAIYDAMDASFGGSFSKLVEMDQNGLPKVDEDGRLVLRYDKDETFSTRIRRSTGELYPAVGNGIPKWNALDIMASALEAAFSAGMQHVTERLSGRGAKDAGPLTPDIAKAELREVFDNVLQSQRNAIDSIAIEQALREYREKHSWLGVNPLDYIRARSAVEDSHRYRPAEK